MILQALANYYERLSMREDSGLAPRGFSPEQVSYEIVLDTGGRIVQVSDIQDTSGKKPRPRVLMVPQGAKRTVGVKSNFFWDKTSYVLGVSNTSKRSDKEHQAFRDLHLEALADASDEGLVALRKFIENWQPSTFDQGMFTEEMKDKNFVFRLDGRRERLHESPAAKALVMKRLDAEPSQDEGEGGSEDGQMMMCLVSGKMARSSRLHPSLKGVDGAQSSGASLVSFNQNSFTSYGKEQGDNAPVSDEMAFAYTTALNHLLRRDAQNRQRLKVGDTTVVFWAEVDGDAESASACELSFAAFLSPRADDASESDKVRAILESIRRGRAPSEVDPRLDPAARMYVLGLAPNASRLSVRFWLTDTFGSLLRNLAQHREDMRVMPEREGYVFPSPWGLALATAPNREGAMPKMDDAFNNLVGEMLRAIMGGGAYPRSLLANAVMRMRSDGTISANRVAICKGVMVREKRLLNRNSSEDIPVSLDRNSTEPGYLLGRLFGVLEDAQGAAMGGSVNATIRDRYYGAASATPASIFPVLLRNSSNHLSKIRKDSKGRAVNIEKSIQEIMDKMPDHFPKSLNIEGQGRFAIGYYHQHSERFKGAGGNNAQGHEIDASRNHDEGEQE